jgi:hypothetical protein
MAAPGGGVHIGRAGQYDGQYFNGLVDDFRVTKGVARYTSDFAPPARALPETGGDSFVTVNVNAGVVQRFTTVGTTAWTAPTDVTQIEVLVVAGGGAGGGGGASTAGGAGGGAGGLIYNNQYPVTPGQTYTVTVGAGGTPGSGTGASATGDGNNGSNSVFGNLTAIGGGGGRAAENNWTSGISGKSGGSGGGAPRAQSANAGGAGTAGQGFAGGNSADGWGGAGAGGGAGAVGGNGVVGTTGSISPAGGVGLQFGINGAPTYYAGGGGSGNFSQTAGLGGLGGGGAGNIGGNANGVSGTANTGGGGGGGGGQGTSFGGAGGSGVVIVRYTTTAVGNTSDATTDNLVDSPTQYGHDMGLGGEVVGNYATFNPLFSNGQTYTLSNGNLTVSNPSSWLAVLGTIAVSTGKWYFESYPADGVWHMTGVDQITRHTSHVGGNSSTKGVAFVFDPSDTRGDISYNGGNSVYTGASTSFNAGDVIGVALDLDNNNVKFYKNGVLQYNLSNILQAGASYTFGVSLYSGGTISGNFGQRAWAYAPPAGFNALTTKNLPRLTNAAAISPNQYFGVSTWTQGATDVTLINDGGFQPDLVWIKSRSNSQNHYLIDSVRGSSYTLRSNSTAAESNYTPNITFNSNGFTPSATNAVTNTYTYVAWQWRAGGAAVSNTAGTISSQVSANTVSGFSIATFTGTGVAATVGHGLGVAPKMVVIKQRNGINNWPTWHAGILGGTGYYIYWDSTNGLGTSTTVFNGTNPTSSVFSVGTNSLTNGSTNTYVAYCWAEVDGFSKIGSYIGNGSTDGPFVYCGFKPAYIMIKNSTTGSTFWLLYDSKRSTYNPLAHEIYVQDLDIEYSPVNRLDFLSNGFKVRNTSNAINTVNDNYVFMAFAEKPFGNANGTAR